MANIYDVVNLARTQLKWEDRIPLIDRTNLEELSLLPPEDLNEFLKVVQKIVRQYVFDTTYDESENPFARFYNQKLPVGATVEDLYVDLITGNVPAWNDDGSYALSKKLPSVTALYHSINYENQYKVSTSYAQMKTGFLTEGGFDSMVNRINGTLNSSAQYDLYLQCLNLISTAVKRGAFKLEGGYSIANESGIKALTKRVKVLSKEFKFMNDKYNYYGFVTKANESNIVILAKPSTIETINVDYLAGVFNMSKGEIKDMIIEVPEDYGFGELDASDSKIHPLMLIMDKRMLRIFPTLYEGSSIYNPASLVTNTFLTLQYIFSFGLFFNAVALCTDDFSEQMTITNYFYGLSGFTGSVKKNGTAITTDTFYAQNGDIIEVDGYEGGVGLSDMYDCPSDDEIDIEVTSDGNCKFKIHNTPYQSTSANLYVPS